MSCGIYNIVNIINNKRYVGKSVKIEDKRWKEHIRELNKNDHYNEHLLKAWNKYGRQGFKFEILEECVPDKLKEREEYWINFYESYKREKGYNIRILSEGVDHISEETKKKISEANKGSIPWNKGKTEVYSEEILERMREAQRGKVYSEETLIKRRIANKGENNPRAKLNWDKVREIREKYHPGIYTIKMLSEEYGISIYAIKEIIYNKNWIEEKRREYPKHIVSEETKKKLWEKRERKYLFEVKLDWEKAREIRKFYKEKVYNYKQLSEIYDVSESTIRNIVDNRSWKE